MSVSRKLTRVNFVSEGPFEQDPAINRPPFPALDMAKHLSKLNGDEYRFYQFHLKRARNEIVNELRSAQRDVQATLTDAELA